MISGNSKTSLSHVLILNLTDKIYSRGGGKSLALSSLSIYYTWEHIKSSYNNNKFKISAPTWNEEFELPDGSYSVSGIHNYFEYFLKKAWRKSWYWFFNTNMWIKLKIESYLK